MASYFVRRYSEMVHEKTAICSYSNYFGLNDRFEIVVREKQNSQDTIELEIEYRQNVKKYIDFNNLPDVLCQEINSYLGNYISAVFSIIHPYRYPFNPPIWYLDTIIHNIGAPNIDIREYISYVVNNHNNQYERDWSPVIDISKDILEFIQKINNFEYMIGNKI